MQVDKAIKDSSHLKFGNKKGMTQVNVHMLFG